MKRKLRKKYGEEAEFTVVKPDSVTITFTSKNLDEVCKEMIKFIFNYKWNKLEKWLITHF
jgi:hypothetical protein